MAQGASAEPGGSLKTAHTYELFPLPFFHEIQNLEIKQIQKQLLSLIHQSHKPKQLKTPQCNILDTQCNTLLLYYTIV